MHTRANSLTVTESHEIARAPQSSQMMKMGSDRAQKFQPVRSRVDYEICAHTRTCQIFDHHAKYFANTESIKITWVPQFGHMAKIGSDWARKLRAVRSREYQEICACMRERQEFDRHGFAQNRMGTTIRRNYKDGK